MPVLEAKIVVTVTPARCNKVAIAVAEIIPEQIIIDI
jgi:hypothetical protein